MAKGRGLKGKAEKVSEKDFQKQLQSLVGDLSEASDKLKGKEKKSHKARNRVMLLTGVTLGVLYNPWTGQATRDWIMEQIAGGDGAGLEELEAELAAEAEAEARARRQRLRALDALALQGLLESTGNEPAGGGDVVGLEQDGTGRRQRRRGRSRRRVDPSCRERDVLYASPREQDRVRGHDPVVAQSRHRGGMDLEVEVRRPAVGVAGVADEADDSPAWTLAPRRRAASTPRGARSRTRRPCVSRSHRR